MALFASRFATVAIWVVTSRRVSDAPLTMSWVGVAI